MLDSIALLNGMTQKMDYLQTRQRVLAENVSNANTPGYQAMDVAAPDFKKTMGSLAGAGSLGKLALTTTTEGQVSHMQLLNHKDSGSAVRQTYDISPTKNSVTLEEQMMAGSKTAIDYQLVTNLYNKNLGLLRTAMKH